MADLAAAIRAEIQATQKRLAALETALAALSGTGKKRRGRPPADGEPKKRGRPKKTPTE